MSQITQKQLLDFPYFQYASQSAVARGMDFFRDRRILEANTTNPEEAFFLVEGGGGEYEVSIQNLDDELVFICDCPHAENGNFCKHMVACALDLSETIAYEEKQQKDALINLLETELDERIGERGRQKAAQTPMPAVTSSFMDTSSYVFPQWKFSLERLLEHKQKKPFGSSNPKRYAAFLLLYLWDNAYRTSISVRLMQVKAQDLPFTDEPGIDKDVINRLLSTDLSWQQNRIEVNAKTNPDACMNLDPNAVTLFQFLQNQTRFFSNEQVFAPFYSSILQYKIPVFLIRQSKGNASFTPVEVLPKPVDFTLVLERTNGQLRLSADTDIGGNETEKDEELQIFFRDPAWVISGSKLYILSDTQNLDVLSVLPLSIPPEAEDSFVDAYLPRLLQQYPLKSSLINWVEIDEDPVPRLYLEDDAENTLRAVLRFGYGDQELPAEDTPPAFVTQMMSEYWDVCKVHRKGEQENIFYNMLIGNTYRLKRGKTSDPYGTFFLRARAHPYDFLVENVPMLIGAGFEVYGEEKLKIGKVNRSTPSLRVHVSSEVDWFDLQAMIVFGEQQVSLSEVRKSLLRGKRYIKLADGSVGKIPDEWLERYRQLWNLAEETDKGYRIRDIQLPLLDQLIEDNIQIDAPADMKERRERLRSFEHIQPQPVPVGFQGSLRPYQKYGLDWLHFLHEYHMGGILADDMGLGKTIQVLAFLQSLKENAAKAPVNLLVVPKSLMTNWQREAERFTPGMRVLEFIGNKRNKDFVAFQDYDIILTTYGTMRRDAAFLRRFKFHYIILDESQAIKNPLAKSSRAVRLLQADNRLVMTGTPIENNTFELWAQFAFLNPGMLGSLEKFRVNFANPIEAEKDERAAETLRRMVYPFLLRRTKEQVAPELPPRTERILYTDMAPAQKRLYADIRDRYRAELLGLTESEGMQDVRFKILEGLLRLRQMAIHPVLVDSGYRGEVPKFELLLETLETLKAGGHKALIFSQFVETLSLLKKELSKQAYSFAYLDGQTQDRQAEVDRFQNDPSVSFFLISLKAGGVGLNLTAADYVFHLDPWWNPAVELQASDRAHRIGQERPVFVYRIISRGTVEEKILLLQEKKKALVDNIITTEGGFFKNLTPEDLSDLFN